jgi:hypothetical protein
MYRDLSRAGDGELYDALDSVDRLRAFEGQGGSLDAEHVRVWCRREKARITRALRGRGLPTARRLSRWTDRQLGQSGQGARANVEPA